MQLSIKNIQGILFDMDGTLLNSIQAVENSWRGWSRRHGLDEDLVVKTAHGRPARDTIALLAPQSNQQAEAEWVLQAELNDPGVVPIPGALEFLQQLRTIPWGIVTSANRSLATYRLDLVGLPIPQVFITVEDVTVGKPDPQGYLLGAKQLGLRPADCLVVEDTPAGLMAGKRAGMRLMGIGTTFGKDELEAEVLIKNYLGASITPDNTILVRPL